jgi:hypothetical protein
LSPGQIARLEDALTDRLITASTAAVLTDGYAGNAARGARSEKLQQLMQEIQQKIVDVVGDEGLLKIVRQQGLSSVVADLEDASLRSGYAGEPLDDRQYDALLGLVSADLKGRGATSSYVIPDSVMEGAKEILTPIQYRNLESLRQEKRATPKAGPPAGR